MTAVAVGAYLKVADFATVSGEIDYFAFLVVIAAGSVALPWILRPLDFLGKLRHHLVGVVMSVLLSPVNLIADVNTIYRFKKNANGFNVVMFWLAANIILATVVETKLANKQNQPDSLAFASLLLSCLLIFEAFLATINTLRANCCEKKVKTAKVDL